MSGFRGQSILSAPLGCGKSMIAKRIPTILPDMEEDAALEVTIFRVKYTHTFPASFILVAAMNPCPCGYYGYQKCHCTDYEVLKYRRKISGPILDRIDIQKYIQAVDFMNLSSSNKGVSSKELRCRVEAARQIQKERFQGKGISCNAQMSTSFIKEYCKIEEDSKKLLQLAYDRFRYSARTFHKFLKVSRTFADMDGSENIRKSDIAKALMCRDLDKEQANMIVV